MGSAGRWIRAYWHLGALATLAVGLLWYPVGLPFRLLVIVFHEASHAFAALATGGRVEAMSVDIMEGGHAITVGGNFFVIVSAGYVGSLLIGAGLFVLSIRSGLDRLALGVLGAVVGLLAVVYMRDPFALVFCLAMALAMLSVARWMPAAAADYLLRLIGLVSMLYVPADIVSDTILRSVRSDATILADAYFGPPLMWGVLWLAISIAVIVVAFRFLPAPAPKTDGR